MEPEVDFDTNPTDLYTAICQGECEAAVTLAKEKPEDARTWVVRYNPEDDNAILWRFLPLHSACARQTTDALIEALLVAYPEAASAKDDQGFLPLHYACGNRASDAVVNMLLIVYPQAASIQDPYGGKLPIHHLSQWGTFSAGVVSMLLAVHPQAIHVKDHSGYTPLDLAKAANYPGRNVVITALKRCTVTSKKRSTEIESLDRGVDVTREIETLKYQAEKILELEDETDKLRKDNEGIQANIDKEASISNETLSQEQEKVSALAANVSSQKLEVETIRNTYHQSEKDQANNLDDIDSFRDEIVNLKKETERTIKERDTLQEKLILKMKTSDDTIKKLEKRVDEQKVELDEKFQILSTLEKKVEALQLELDNLHKENEGMEEEINVLRESKDISEKIDVVYATIQKLQARYEKMRNVVVENERMFKASVVEREQKILEIAQLEEQLRVATTEEHDKLMTELNEQDEDIRCVIEIVG